MHDGPEKRVKWEATCYHPAHKAGASCRWTQSFRSDAEEQIVLRRLRWWCLQGRDMLSRDAHFAAKRVVKLASAADLPTEARLEEMHG